MDKCEPITLAGVKALGEAHLKCCVQMCYSLALIAKGSVRTLVRSVEESNGAEAWRLIHSSYAPHTQNRQYTLMQKIMMPAKLWCDHAEAFESGLRAWELDVVDWERSSGTALADAVKYLVMMNNGTDLSQERLASGYLRRQKRSSQRSDAMVLLFPQFGNILDSINREWNRC